MAVPCRARVLVWRNQKVGEGEGPMQETRIAVLGCGGRMGRRLLAISLETAGGRVVAGTLRTGSPLEGQDLGRLAGHGEIGIKATSDAEGAFGVCDVAIDFTSPQATMEHLKLAVRHRKALVVGTTGLDDEQLAELREAAREVPILYARNMSLGINLLAILVEQAARLLGPEYDIEILEMHHRHKVDAPSGTALPLGGAAPGHQAAAWRGARRGPEPCPARRCQGGP